MIKLKGIDFWDQKTFDSNLTKGQLIFTTQTNQYTVESKHTQRDRCDSPHLHSPTPQCSCLYFILLSQSAFYFCNQ